jgi:hypothetical protein
MDWGKAKNLIIIFLSVLNMLLLALVIRDRLSYYVTADQERAIRGLLSRNGISMYSEMLRDFTPKKELSMAAYNYDMSSLSSAFFGDRTVTQTVVYNRTIYMAGDAMLTLQSGSLSYTNATGTGALELTRESAAAACSEFIKKMGPDFTGFRLDRTKASDLNMRLEYRDTYKKELVYSNYIIFELNETGIIRIDLIYNKTKGYSSQPPREICPADEALFAFLQRVSETAGAGSYAGLFINKMDMVYLQEEMGSDANAVYTASPYYRIYVDDVDEPYLVNAYLGTVR